MVPETGADVATAVRAGARGVVFEDRLGEALVPTAGAVRAGQLAVPRRFHRHAVKPRLSYRERQVLGLMAIGVGTPGSRLPWASRRVRSRATSQRRWRSSVCEREGRLRPSLLTPTRASDPASSTCQSCKGRGPRRGCRHGPTFTAQPWRRQTGESRAGGGREPGRAAWHENRRRPARLRLLGCNTGEIDHGSGGRGDRGPCRTTGRAGDSSSQDADFPAPSPWSYLRRRNHSPQQAHRRRQTPHGRCRRDRRRGRPRSITHPDDRCRTVRAGCCPADEATPRRLGGSAASAGADPQSSGSWSHERRDRSQAVGLREHRQEPSLGAVHKAGGSLTVRGRHHAQRADGMGFRPRTRRKPRTPQRKIC